jgi:hypothetical protein
VWSRHEIEHAWAVDHTRYLTQLLHESTARHTPSARPGSVTMTPDRGSNQQRRGMTLRRLVPRPISMAMVIGRGAQTGALQVDGCAGDAHTADLARHRPCRG